MKNNFKYFVFFLILILISLSLWIVNDVGETSTAPPTAEEQTESFSTATGSTYLSYIAKHEMEGGTHRPEIFVYGDNLYLLVVDPEPEAGIQHKGYIFSASEPSNINFGEYNTFALTPEGSDHRATIIGNEIVAVYQVNVMREDLPEGPLTGPSEQYAESQKLMMAKFSLNGEEIFRGEILSTTDFDEDNFPDMCILPWGEESFLVSTGSKGYNFKIREVNLNGDIISEKLYTFDRDRGSNIGNSMFAVDNGFLFFSSTDQSITVTEFDKDLNMGNTVVIEQENGLAYTFPTGIVDYGNYYIVGYSSHESGDLSIESNPLYPALMVLTENFDIVLDGQISTLFPSIGYEAGSGHVHPTIAIVADRLFYTWSKSVQTGNLNQPQVQIEEFKWSFD